MNEALPWWPEPSSKPLNLTRGEAQAASHVACRALHATCCMLHVAHCMWHAVHLGCCGMPCARRSCALHCERPHPRAWMDAARYPARVALVSPGGAVHQGCTQCLAITTIATRALALQHTNRSTRDPRGRETAASAAPKRRAVHCPVACARVFAYVFMRVLALMEGRERVHLGSVRASVPACACA